VALAKNGVHLAQHFALHLEANICEKFYLYVCIWERQQQSYLPL
jgi:hypothetical protein